MDQLLSALPRETESFSRTFQREIDAWLTDLSNTREHTTMALTLPPLVITAILRKLNTAFSPQELEPGEFHAVADIVDSVKDQYSAWLQDPQVVTYKIGGKHSNHPTLQTLEIFGTRCTLKGLNLSRKSWPKSLQAEPLVRRLVLLFIAVLRFWVTIKTTFRKLELKIRRLKGAGQGSTNLKEGYRQRYRYGGFDHPKVWDLSNPDGHHLPDPYQTDGAPYTNSHLPEYILKRFRLENLGKDTYNEFHRLINEIRLKYQGPNTLFNFIHGGNVDFYLTALPSMLDTSYLRTPSDIDTIYDRSGSSTGGVSSMSLTTSSSEVSDDFQDYISGEPISEPKNIFCKNLSESYSKYGSKQSNKGNFDENSQHRMYKFPENDNTLCTLTETQQLIRNAIQDRKDQNRKIADLEECNRQTVTKLDEHQKSITAQKIQLWEHEQRLSILSGPNDNLNLGFLEFAQALIPDSQWHNRSREDIEKLRVYKHDRDLAAHGPNLDAHLDTYNRHPKLGPCITALYGVDIEVLTVYVANGNSADPAEQEAWKLLRTHCANISLVKEALTVYCLMQSIRCNPPPKLINVRGGGNSNFYLPASISKIPTDYKSSHFDGQIADPSKFKCQAEEVMHMAIQSIRAFMLRVNARFVVSRAAVQAHGDDISAREEAYKNVFEESIETRLKLDEWRSIMRLIQFGELVVFKAIADKKYRIVVPPLPKWKQACLSPDKPMDNQNPRDASEVMASTSPR